MFMMDKADLIKTTNSLLHSLMTQVVAKLKIKDAKVTGYTPEYGTYIVTISREVGHDVMYLLHRANCSLCISGIVDKMIEGEKAITHPLYWLSEDDLYKEYKEPEIGTKAFEHLLLDIISLILTNYALVVEGSVGRYHPLQEYTIVMENGVLLAVSKDETVTANYTSSDKVLVEVDDIMVASGDNLKQLRGVITKILNK